MGKPWQFQRGNRANPHGRPAGSRNKATLLLDEIAEGQAAELLRTVIKRARRGDMRAAAIVLSRCWPQRKARVRFTLPEMLTPADLPKGLAVVAQHIADGTLAPEEGQAIASVLEQQRRAIELTEIETRLRQIEEKMKR